MDLPQPKADRLVLERRSRTFRRIVTAALSLGLVMLGTRYQAQQSISNPLLILFSVFLIFILSIFLHEVGHVLAGWLVGMRLRSFGVLRFLAYKTVGGWRIRWDSKTDSLGGIVTNYTTITSAWPQWRS